MKKGCCCVVVVIILIMAAVLFFIFFPKMTVEEKTFYTKAEYQRIEKEYSKHLLEAYKIKYNTLSTKPLTITSKKLEEYKSEDSQKKGIKINGNFEVKPFVGENIYYNYICTFEWDSVKAKFIYLGTDISEV